MDRWSIHDYNNGQEVRIYRYARIAFEPRLDGISAQVVRELGGVMRAVENSGYVHIVAYYFSDNEVFFYEVQKLSQAIKWVTMNVLEDVMRSPEAACKSSEVSFSEIEPGLWGYLNVDNF